MENSHEYLSQTRALAHIKANNMLSRGDSPKKVLAYLMKNGDTLRQAQNVVIAYDKIHNPDHPRIVLKDKESKEKKGVTKRKQTKEAKRRKFPTRAVIIATLGVVALLVGGTQLNSIKSYFTSSNSIPIESPKKPDESLCIVAKKDESFGSAIWKATHNPDNIDNPMTKVVESQGHQLEHAAISSNLKPGEYSVGKTEDGRLQITPGCTK